MVLQKWVRLNRVDSRFRGNDEYECPNYGSLDLKENTMAKPALSPHIANVQQINLQILEQKTVITESVALDELTGDERIRLLNMLSLGIDAMTALRNRVRGVTPTDELVKVDAKDRVRRKTVAKGIKGEREFLKPLASAYKPRKPLIKAKGKPVSQIVIDDRR